LIVCEGSGRLRWGKDGDYRIPETRGIHLFSSSRT
jgi:hypothetical protein